MSATKLRLRAETEEDLAVFGGILQDALLPVSDIAYLADNNQFALVANRFCWEVESADGEAAADVTAGDRTHYRVNCGLLFTKVTSAQTRGFDRNDTATILSLLTIQTETGVEGVEITLICAGDASIRLTVESIDCRLDDMGEPWPTVWRPSHGDVEDD